MNTEVIGYNLPTWIIIMIVVDAVLLIGPAVGGFFATKNN